MADVTLHRVLPDEWREHRALRLEMLSDAPDAFWTTHDEAAALDEAAWRVRIAGGYYVQARIGDEPVGMAGMGEDTERGGDEASLISMYVTPRARGRHVGELLVAAVLDEARRLGRRRVVLEVTSDNASARRLYERTGFRLTGIRTPHRRRLDLEELEMTADLGET